MMERTFVSLEQSQAQLFIHVYPSQDNPTSQTLWIFSGTSTASLFGSIRTSSISTPLSNQDSWWFGTPNSGNIFQANGPTNSNISLSSLFSSANTADRNSGLSRIPGGGRTNITFAASATNTLTIVIGSGSRTISHLFLDDDASNRDDMGIRVSGSSLSYSSGNSSAWVGSRIINKAIGDFFTGAFNNRAAVGDPSFAARSNGAVRLVINSQIIPEPEEYALIFGLFALGFVILRRHWQKKRQQTPTS